jgi:adenosine kinase
MAAIEAGTVFTIGNPLLDVSTTVEDEFLAKYELKANDAILAEAKHAPLYDEIVGGAYTVDYVAGGATQNSARVCQALLKVPKSVVYVGCIGDDESGKKLADCSEKAGVDTPYLVDAATATGKCAVLITDSGKNRSLVTDLAAANNYKHDHILTPDVAARVEKAQVYYTAGFFQTVSPDTVIHLGKHAAEKNKIFTTNLSAPFLMQVPPFFAAINNTIPFTDILFGNETEAATFAECSKWEEKTVRDIAVKICGLPKENAARKRMVVFTQGDQPTIVCHDGEVTEYPVLPVEHLLDTNGAGDAFVGGFLSGLAKGESVEECVRAGNYAANMIIQRSGCTYPDEGFEVPAK